MGETIEGQIKVDGVVANMPYGPRATLLTRNRPELQIGAVMVFKTGKYEIVNLYQMGRGLVTLMLQRESGSRTQRRLARKQREEANKKQRL